MSWQAAHRPAWRSVTTVLLGHGAIVWALLQTGMIELPRVAQAMTATLIAEAKPLPAKPMPLVVAPRAVPIVVPPPLVMPAEPEISPITVTTRPAQEAPPRAQTVAVAAVGEPMAAAVAPPRYDADYLDNPAPPYPALARKAGEQGRVLLRVRVSAQGNALEVALHTSSGFSRLDRIALDTVRRWRFIPARQGEREVEATVIVPISFSLAA